MNEKMKKEIIGYFNDKCLVHTFDLSKSKEEFKDLTFKMYLNFILEHLNERLKDNI